jgi:hypothetical protein
VTSKGQPQAKLHFARALRAEDAPEVWRPKDAVWKIEVRAVEQAWISQQNSNSDD